MNRPETHEPVCIEPEAPDRVIAGLLALHVAQRRQLSKGEVLPLQDRPDDWRLVAVESGELLAATESSAWTLGPMQAAAIPGPEGFSLLARQNCAFTMLLLSGKAADALLRGTADRGGLFFPAGGSAVDAVYRSLTVLWEQSGTVSAEAASGAAYELLLRLYRTGASQESAPVPRLVRDAMALMQEEFAFLEGIGDLADRLGVSQEYLTRTFRRYIGVTPGKHLNRLRVEYAKLLLGRQGHSVAFVSDACGFSNGNYFARVFRQFTGMNPSEYARSMQGKPIPDENVPGAFYVL